MNWRPAYRKSGLVAGATTVLLGWLLALPGHSPGRTLSPFVRWSFDLLQLVLPHHRHSDPVIIYMDEQAMQIYGTNSVKTWPRAIHARLLDRLTKDRPRVVIFDVMLTQPGDAAGDAKLAQAIRENGHAILASDKVPLPGIRISYTLVPPLEQFATNAAGTGTAKVDAESDRVGRRYQSGDEQEPDLVWAAAREAGAPITQTPSRRLQEERWLNYYGSARPFAELSMSYSNAEIKEPDFFRDKAVLIGGKPETLLLGEVSDRFNSPFTKWGSEFIPGVEITAIAYANLMHDEWLRRSGFFWELGGLLATGLLAGAGLQILRLRPAVLAAGTLAVLVIATAIVLVLSLRIWTPWAVVAVAQLPCALAFRVFAAGEADRLAPAESQPSVRTPSDGPTLTDPAAFGRPEVADHTLIRCIGEGSYGQVWIARNAIGLFHAVKVVYRNRFGVDAPYERALRGIQKFMPVSRSHEGFVHILHVGRNEAAGCFFYIMEAGDDQNTGQQIEPETYQAKTLATELRERGTIPPRESLEVMLALTEAVERLHQHQLIHRDIKPSNVIFVNHRPKLADIDLVTDLAAAGEVSRIGTEGYMAPEGPGTAAADVFSLGRILYVTLTGKTPAQCPDLPTDISSQPDTGLFLELHAILCKACEFDLGRRYASAAAMRADLLEARERFESKEA